MERLTTEELHWFDRVQGALNDLSGESVPLEQRAAQIAETLRSLVPGVSLYGCALRCRGVAAAAALDSSGRPLRLAADRLGAVLAEDENLAERAERLLGEIAETAGQRRLIQAVEVPNYCYGLLALAVPAEAASDTEALGRLLLRMLGARLALQLHVQALDQEVRSLTAKADVGEVAGPLAHELNNWLNALLLHVAVLEQEVPEACRSELTQVRQQSKQLALLIKEWQQYRQAQHATAEPIDIHQVIRNTVSALAPDAPATRTTSGGSPPSIATDLTARTTQVMAAPADLNRLLRFLINQIATTLPPGNTLTVRTATAGSQVVMRLEWQGPASAAELLTAKLDLAAEAADRLEMAACDTLVRRMQGRLRLENNTNSSNSIVVELPAVPQA